MKLTISLALFGALAAICVATNEVNQAQESRIDPVTGTMLAAALVPIVTNMLSGFLGFLFKPSDFHDTVVYGRGMRIQLCSKENAGCIQLTDRATGISFVGTGSTTQEAVGDATKKMFDELLTRNLLSLHDLCSQSLVFPHPSPDCQGYWLNPCELAVAPAPTQCKNKMGDSYCLRYATHCNHPTMESYYWDNCFKTCSNGFCRKPNQDPCKVEL